MNMVFHVYIISWQSAILRLTVVMADSECHYYIMINYFWSWLRTSIYPSLGTSWSASNSVHWAACWRIVWQIYSLPLTGFPAIFLKIYQLRPVNFSLNHHCLNSKIRSSGALRRNSAHVVHIYVFCIFQFNRVWIVSKGLSCLSHFVDSSETACCSG